MCDDDVMMKQAATPSPTSRRKKVVARAARVLQIIEKFSVNHLLPLSQIISKKQQRRWLSTLRKSIDRRSLFLLLAAFVHRFVSRPQLTTGCQDSLL